MHRNACSACPRSIVGSGLPCRQSSSHVSSLKKAKPTLELYLLLERNFCTGKQAHCHVWFSHGGKTARDRVVELGCYEFVSHLCGSGRHMVQTVVAHQRNSSPCKPGMKTRRGFGASWPRYPLST